MLDDKLLTQRVHDLIMDLCLVMHGHGIKEVSVGALMRVVGVPDERANAHDGHYLELSTLSAGNTTSLENLIAPPGTTLH